MIIIRFPDSETERRGLGFLATRFPGKSWGTGETLVPEAALAHLAQQGIKLTVEGPATCEQLASLRNPAPAEVQRPERREKRFLPPGLLLLITVV